MCAILNVMKTTQQRHCAIACLLALTVAAGTLMTGCTSTPTRNRGSLSDAMDKARDDNEGSRTVPNEPRQDPQPEPPIRERPRKPDYSQPGNENSSSASDSDTMTVSTEGTDARVWFGLRGGQSIREDREFGSYSDGDIFLDVQMAPSADVVLYAGYKACYVIEGSELDQSVEDGMFFFKAGVEGRYTPLPALPLFSPYVYAGIGGFSMFWAFENTLYSGSEAITSDGINGMILNVGAGLYLINLDRFRVGMNISPEVYLFGPLTNEGFNNDYFGAYGTVKVTLEASARF